MALVPTICPEEGKAKTDECPEGCKYIGRCEVCGQVAVFWDLSYGGVVVRTCSQHSCPTGQVVSQKDNFWMWPQWLSGFRVLCGWENMQPARARKVKLLYPAKPIWGVAARVVRIQGAVWSWENAASTCQKVKLLCAAKGNHIGVVDANFRGTPHWCCRS